MGELKQREIFSRNLNRYVAESGKTQLEIANAIGVSAQTFNSWCRGIAIPRMDKIQRLSDYFKIKKSDLIDDTSSSDASILSDDEIHLIDKYRSLNDIGKREALKRVDELTQIEIYIKIQDHNSEAV